MNETPVWSTGGIILTEERSYVTEPEFKWSDLEKTQHIQDGVYPDCGSKRILSECPLTF
jgi:hypothetical protein